MIILTFLISDHSAPLDTFVLNKWASFYNAFHPLLQLYHFRGQLLTLDVTSIVRKEHV